MNKRSLFYPTHKAKTTAAENNENDDMANQDEVKGSAEQDGDTHVGEANENRVDKSQDCTNDGLKHAPLRPCRVKVHSNSCNNMFPILLTKDPGYERYKRSETPEKICDTAFEDSTSTFSNTETSFSIQIIFSLSVTFSSAYLTVSLSDSLFIQNDRLTFYE
jgi:hypothetical protein